jgi:polar amino acid transport system substrate-binding protein
MYTLNQDSLGKSGMSRTVRSLSMFAVSAAAVLGLSACGSDAAAPDTTVAAAAEAEAEAEAEVAAPTGAAFNQALFDQLPESIRTSKVIKLATDPTDPPLEFYNEANVMVGAEVDLAAALGTVLGIKVEMIPSKFDAIIPGVEAGRFDGSLSGFADRKERQKVVDFVDFYTTSRGYLIKTGTFPELKDATDLCGRKVAVAKGTTMADAIGGLSTDCVAAGKAAIDGQIYPDQSACVLAVQSARADLTILSGHAALWIAKGSEGALDVVLRPTEGNDINGMVLKKGELMAPMQAAIQQLMDAGTLREIFTTWNLQAVVLDKASVNAGTN